MKNLIIATENAGKFIEISTLLNHEFDRIYSLSSFNDPVEVVEDGESYSENAMKKARKVGDRYCMCTLADDSGLEVEALGNGPGLWSSRYGENDDARIARLLKELEGVPWEKRRAVFKAYLALYLPQKEREYLFYGQLEGIILFERCGTGGFGYDPVFYVPELDKCLADVSPEEKNRISHRGRAIQSLMTFLGTTDLF